MNPAFSEPDAAARDHSAKVAAHVLTLLNAQGGWLSLHDYMQAALYAPGLGYYMAGTQKFGERGDFITAPELTPLYAQTWATPIAQAMASSSLHVLELGAGSGIFAAQLLRTLHDEQTSPERYCILEPSPILRAHQQDTLSRIAPECAHRVEWLDRLPDIFHGVVFMNEVLDAIPPRVITRRSGNWLEHGVEYRKERFVAASRPLSDPVLQTLAESRFPGEGDYVAELNLASEALVYTLARLLLPGGALFISDYGFERDASLPARYAAGTLRAYYRHHLLDDPLQWPGLIDLTAHVDFVAIAEAAQRGGLPLVRFQTQSDFLLSHGILERLPACGMPGSAAYRAAVQATHTLMAPEVMGDIFKVLYFQLPSASSPADS